MILVQFTPFLPVQLSPFAVFMSPVISMALLDDLASNQGKQNNILFIPMVFAFLEISAWGLNVSFDKPNAFSLILDIWVFCCMLWRRILLYIVVLVAAE